ncbi:MAG: DUF4252 domain-containing protein [bacterium]
MNKSRFGMITLAFGLSAMLSGCLWVPEFSSIVAEIQKQVPEARFKKSIQLNLGPASLGFARAVLGLASDHDNDVLEAKSYLEEVQSVKIAVYETYNLRSAKKIRMPAYLEKMIARNKWQTVVKVQEDREYVMAVYKMHRRSITEMFVLALNTDELVLVQVEGRLDKLFEKVMEEHVDVGDIFISRR